MMFSVSVKTKTCNHKLLLYTVAIATLLIHSIAVILCKSHNQNFHPLLELSIKLSYCKG